MRSSRGCMTGSCLRAICRSTLSWGALRSVESVVRSGGARQVRVIRSAYEVIDDRGALIEKRFVEWPYRWTHRFEAEYLLERAGFEVDAVYGGYAREAFTSDSASMV